MSDEEIADVLSAIEQPVKIPKGAELYKSGTLGILTNGKATVKRFNDGGASTTIRTCVSGEVFGSASIFGEWKSGMSSIIATQNCEVLYISENAFCDLLKKYPQMSINYITFLSDKIRFLNRKLDTFTANSTEEKLYEFLLSLSDEDGNANLDFGIAELSRRIKIGRTSIYRDMSSLEEKGLITRNGNKFKIKKLGD